MAGEVDWSRIAETLRLRKLLPVLGPRIREIANDSATEEFSETVEHALEECRRQGAFLQLISLHTMTLLADAGIPSVALKGPFLAETIYGDVGRRLSSDIDLLVAPDRLRAAVDVVHEMGYERPTDYVERDGLPLLHFVLQHARGELPPIELHWRIHWYEGSFANERLLPAEPRSASTWRPAPADELVSLLLFYARDGFVDLRAATDLSAWWDALGNGVVPGALFEVLAVYPALSRAVVTALAVARRIVGLPIGSVAGGTVALSLRDQIAIRLANPNPRESQSQLYADIGLIDGLLSPPGGLGAFIRRQVLPPREVLAEQARHAARARTRSRFSRFVGVLARYIFAIVRLVRAPEILK